MQKQIFKQNDNALSVHSKQLDVYWQNNKYNIKIKIKIWKQLLWQHMTTQKHEPKNTEMQMHKISLKWVILNIVGEGHSLYTVTKLGERTTWCFIKKTPFCLFHNSLKWWSIYTKFVPVVAEEILIQNIATKYGS